MLSCRVSLLLLAAFVCVDYCHTASIPRGFDPRFNDEVIMNTKKRPFCNAFTGCGRKRSPHAPGMPAQEFRQRQYVDDESLGSILDSEMAIEELSRQILSEAKLYEAMQEAGEEARRRQKEIPSYQ